MGKLSLFLWVLLANLPACWAKDEGKRDGAPPLVLGLNRPGIALAQKTFSEWAEVISALRNCILQGPDQVGITEEQKASVTKLLVAKGARYAQVVKMRPGKTTYTLIPAESYPTMEMRFVCPVGHAVEEHGLKYEQGLGRLSPRDEHMEVLIGLSEVVNEGKEHRGEWLVFFRKDNVPKSEPSSGR